MGKTCIQTKHNITASEPSQFQTLDRNLESQNLKFLQTLIQRFYENQNIDSRNNTNIMSNLSSFMTGLRYLKLLICHRVRYFFGGMGRDGAGLIFSKQLPHFFRESKSVSCYIWSFESIGATQKYYSSRKNRYQTTPINQNYE